LAAVRDDAIGLLILAPDSGFVDVATMLNARPTIAVVVDDVGFSGGPSTFDRSALTAIFSAAALVAIVTGEPVAEDYAFLAGVAARGRTVAIVETTVANEAAWDALAARSEFEQRERQC
jgi:hypothetical protein